MSKTEKEKKPKEKVSFFLWILSVISPYSIAYPTIFIEGLIIPIEDTDVDDETPLPE